MLEKNKLNNSINILFFLFIILCLFQGYVCKYLKYGVCFNSFFQNFWEENGFIESLQCIFLTISITYLIFTLIKFKNIKLFKYFFIIKIIGLTYYLGEEISWGQHYFRWNSPGIFLEINNQKETNIHNISNLFDQLPRTLVLIWCSFAAILSYSLSKLNYLKNNILLILSPSYSLILISILTIFLIIPDLIIDKFGFHPGHVDEFGKDILEARFFDTITFNFIRLSELHELVFCYYFLMYSLNFYKIDLMTRKVN